MQKQLNFVLLLAFMLSFSYNAIAQNSVDTLRLSMNEAVDLGMKNNLNLKNTHLDYVIAKKKVWEVTAMGLPQATATGTYQYTPTISELTMMGFNPNSLPSGTPLTKQDILDATQISSVPLGTKNSTSLDITVSQLIFSGEWIVGLQAASAYERLQKKVVERSEYQTKEAITSAYNGVLIIENAYNNLNTSLLSITKLYDDVKAINGQGLNEDTDVDQLKITVNNLRSGVETLKGQILTMNMLLKIQLGLEFDQPIKLTNNLDQLVALAPLQTMVVDSFNIASSVDYQLAQNQVEISKLLVKREYTKFLPTLAGFYVYHDRLSAGGLDFQSANTLGLKLSIPILTGGARLATLSQAKLNRVKAENSQKLAEQGLTVEFTAARNSYLSLYSAYLNLKESMELSLKVYNKDVIKYKEGMLTSMQLTNSQTQYLNSQRSYFDAQLSLLNAKAKLERILTKSE